MQSKQQFPLWLNKLKKRGVKPNYKANYNEKNRMCIVQYATSWSWRRTLREQLWTNHLVHGQTWETVIHFQNCIFPYFIWKNFCIPERQFSTIVAYSCVHSELDWETSYWENLFCGSKPNTNWLRTLQTVTLGVNIMKATRRMSVGSYVLLLFMSFIFWHSAELLISQTTMAADWGLFKRDWKQMSRWKLG